MEQDEFEENGVDIFYYSLELEIEVIDENNNAVDGRTHLFLWNPDSNSNVMLFPYDHFPDRHVGSSINHTQDGIINYELSFYLVEDDSEMVSPVTVEFYSGLNVFTTEDIHLIPVWLDENQITLTNNCDNSVVINWPEATGLGIEEYRIYLNDLYHASVDASTLFYVMEGLEDNTEYHITVEAVTPFGENQITNTVTTMTTKLELDVTTTICAGKSMQISDSQNYIMLPNDLPEGTTLMVSLGEDIDDGTLEAVGAIYRYTLILPEGNEEYQGEFTLSYTYTLKSDDHLDKIGFYSLNEDSGRWEHRGAELDVESNSANLIVNNLSMYGLFVDIIGPHQLTLNVDQVTQNSILLSFSAFDPSGIKEYHIYRDGNLLEVIDGSLNIYEDVGLTANTEYTYYIIAVDNLENISSSQEVIASTLAVIDDYNGPEPIEPPSVQQPDNVQQPSPQEEKPGAILPKTANNTFNIMLFGTILIIISAIFFMYYRKQIIISK